MKAWIANKSAEKDIRNWLTENGYVGRSAKFVEIELHAIKRPGWLQIFRFEMTGHHNEERGKKEFGAMWSDERYGDPKIEVYPDRSARDEQLSEWSTGLITLKRRR